MKESHNKTKETHNQLSNYIDSVNKRINIGMPISSNELAQTLLEHKNNIADAAYKHGQVSYSKQIGSGAKKPIIYDLNGNAVESLAEYPQKSSGVLYVGKNIVDASKNKRAVEEAMAKKSAEIDNVINHMAYSLPTAVVHKAPDYISHHIKQLGEHIYDLANLSAHLGALHMNREHASFMMKLM